MEAESRAEEAEDKVRGIRDEIIGNEIGIVVGMATKISLSLSSVIDYFPSRR